MDLAGVRGSHAVATRDVPTLEGRTARRQDGRTALAPVENQRMATDSSAAEFAVVFGFFFARFFDHAPIFDALARDGRMLFCGHRRRCHQFFQKRSIAVIILVEVIQLRHSIDVRSSRKSPSIPQRCNVLVVTRLSPGQHTLLQFCEDAVIFTLKP